jgi:hypothetical protein
MRLGDSGDGSSGIVEGSADKGTTLNLGYSTVCTRSASLCGSYSQ